MQLIVGTVEAHSLNAAPLAVGEKPLVVLCDRNSKATAIHAVRLLGDRGRASRVRNFRVQLVQEKLDWTWV